MAATLHQMEQLILHALTTRGSQIVFSIGPTHEIRILHAVTKILLSDPESNSTLAHFQSGLICIPVYLL